MSYRQELHLFGGASFQPMSIQKCGMYIIIYNIYPIGSMYGIYANIWGILMVNVTIYSIHGSYGYIYIYYIYGFCFRIYHISFRQFF